MEQDAQLQERSAQLEKSLEACRAALAKAQAQLEQDMAKRGRVEAELGQFRKHLEERTAELRASEERYRSLFHGIPVGLYRTRPDGQILDANQALVQMLGYTSQAEMLALNAANLYIDPGDRVRWQGLLQHEGVVRDFDVRFRRRDGTILWVKNSARMVKDEQGRVLYYEGSLEDIAERRRAEADLRKYQEHLEEVVEARTAELRKSEERYRTLFDGVPVGLYRVTPAGQVLDVNLAAVEMMGYASREEFVPAANAIDVYVDPKQRDRWQALMEQEGVVRDFEEQLRRSDGSVIWVSDSARAVKDEQGQVLYYEGSLEDITQHKRLDEELRRQKDYFEALFLNSPVAIVTADLDARVVSWNPMAVTLFGYAQEEAIGKRLDHLVANHEALRAEGAAYSYQATHVGRLQVTTRRTCKDGSLVDVELLALPLILAGEKAGFIAIYHDITERQRFEEQIRRQKDYFEAVLVNSPVAIVTADVDARIISWNPAAEKLFGYTREEAIGQPIDVVVANDESLRAEAAAYSYQATNVGRLQVTTRRTRKDRSLVDVELLALPLVLAGQKAGFIAIYHDITERKQFEEELRRQKEYFESLFVNSPAAVMTIDQDAKIVSWNPRAQKLLGYSQEEAIGRHIDDLVAKDPLIRQEALDYTRQILTEDRVQATTKRTRKDGSLVEVEILGLPVMVAGKKLGYIVIYHDISELQAARRDAEAASQAKSAFLANMSHELRTPLNAILGFAQLMTDDPNLTPGQRQNLGMIDRSGEHLLSLINDVLEMSKIEAGRVVLKERDADLYDLLDGLEELFRLRAEEKGLALTFQQAPDMPRYVVTDEGKLREVLSNLLGNAVKFTQKGRVTLRVTVTSPTLPDEPGKRTLHFEVEDTGPGMTAEELAVVFQPFVQAASGQQSQEGTGLGLSISQSFVRLMGGDITVKSEPGRGSLFRFDVHVGLADAAKIQAGALERKVLGLAPGQPAYRLLVAEDRETNRRLLVQLLQRLGFDVREAANGQQALETWESWAPHLIWMDMRMPVLDGYEATRRIKATAKGQATIIVALTASAFKEDRGRMLTEGCDDVVRKPFRQAEILDILSKHLGVRFLYEEAAAPATTRPEAMLYP